MLGIVLVSVLLDSLSIESFYMASFVGFLVLVELTNPFNISLRWRSRLRWIILFGLIGMGYIWIRRLLEIIPSSVL
jgi:apolipoprotein N-acyltransferase